MSMDTMDPASLQWATENAPDPDAPGPDVVENTGTPEPVRDGSMDAAAPEPGKDDAKGWGQTYMAVTRHGKAGRAAANNGTGPVATDVLNTVDTIEVPPTDWSPIVVTVTEQAGQLVGRQKARRSLTLVNNGAVTVYVGPSLSILSAPAQGFPIAAGAALDLPTQGAIYAVTAAGTGDAQVVGILTYDVGGEDS